MVWFNDPVVWSFGGLAGLIAWRWLWLRNERWKLLRLKPADDETRFHTVSDDEDDKTYHGKVIQKLRAWVTNGRVEVHWKYNEGFAYRGFLLTGQVRRNDGPWEPLPFKPHQDSERFIEILKYGDTSNYLFTVTKTYRFFCGLAFFDDSDEIVCDQISFVVRNGRFLKEMRDCMRDRRELAAESNEYAKLELEFRRIATRFDKRPLPDPKLQAFEDRYAEASGLDEFVRRKVASIRANPNLSEEQREREIERVHQIAEEMRLEES